MAISCPGKHKTWSGETWSTSYHDKHGIHWPEWQEGVSMCRNIRMIQSKVELSQGMSSTVPHALCSSTQSKDSAPASCELQVEKVNVHAAYSTFMTAALK
jgi:hypothetical protein